MSKGRQTRERILERAAALFNTRGYGRASLSDIMHVTGLEKGGIYNHFESKQALTLAAFDHAVEIVSRPYREALTGKRPTMEKLLALLEAFRCAVEAPSIPGGCPILNAAIESDWADPALCERARAAFELWRTSIAGVIGHGVKSGELRADVDAQAEASVLLATLEGATMMSLLYRDTSHIRVVLEHLASHVKGFAAVATTP